VPHALVEALLADRATAAAVVLEIVTGDGGRFELGLTHEDIGELRLRSDGAAVRRTLPRLGDSNRLDLGDIEIPPAVRLTVSPSGSDGCRINAARDGCRLNAAGPLGGRAVVVVSARIVSAGQQELLLPEAGEWHLAAQCGRREKAITPRTIHLPNDTFALSVNVSVVRSPEAGVSWLPLVFARPLRLRSATIASVVARRSHQRLPPLIAIPARNLTWLLPVRRMRR
jgi:hypothetical protein